MYRIVVDTNVIISAWINKNGSSRQFFTKYLTNDMCVFITSGEIIAEVKKVANRPKFKRYGEGIDEFLHPIMTTSRFVKIKSNFKVIEEDPDDDVIVNTAHDGHADYIVSGDGDLLRLKEYKKIRIVTVSAMLEILRHGS